jgi:hypothetical protein
LKRKRRDWGERMKRVDGEAEWKKSAGCEERSARANIRDIIAV